MMIFSEKKTQLEFVPPLVFKSGLDHGLWICHVQKLNRLNELHVISLVLKVGPKGPQYLPYSSNYSHLIESI